MVNGHFELSYMTENPNWSIMNWFKSGFHGINGYQSYHQPNIIYVFYNFFHPAYLFCGIVFLFFLKKQDFSTLVSKWLLFSILVYALFLAGFDSQNMRFLILSFPLVLILLFPAFERLVGFLIRKKLFYGVMVCIFLLQIIFAGYSFTSVYNSNKNDRDIVKAIQVYPGKTVYTFEVDGIIQAYQLHNKSVNIWYKPITSIQPNSLLVLNPDKIRTQFKGQIVEQNLELIFKKGHPVLIRSFNDGINLYQLNP